MNYITLPADPKLDHYIEMVKLVGAPVIPDEPMVVLAPRHQIVGRHSPLALSVELG